MLKLELARIGTIHAFCGDLLRERPVGHVVKNGDRPSFTVKEASIFVRLAPPAAERWPA